MFPLLCLDKNSASFLNHLPHFSFLNIVCPVPHSTYSHIRKILTWCRYPICAKVSSAVDTSVPLISHKSADVSYNP